MPLRLVLELPSMSSSSDHANRGLAFLDGREREICSFTAIFPTVTSEAVPPNVVSLLFMSVVASMQVRMIYGLQNTSSNIWIYPLNVRDDLLERYVRET